MLRGFSILRGEDLNLRPRGYEPRELPGCSTPLQLSVRIFTYRPQDTKSREDKKGTHTEAPDTIEFLEAACQTRGQTTGI